MSAFYLFTFSFLPLQKKSDTKWVFPNLRLQNVNLSRQNDFSFLSSIVVFILFIYKKNMIVQCLCFHINNNTFLSLCNTYDLFPAKTSSFIFGRKLEDRRSLSRRTKIL